jgi:superfamily II DNA or RNA helicase
MTERDGEVVKPMQHMEGDPMVSIAGAEVPLESVREQLESLPPHYADALRNLGDYLDQAKTDPETRVLYDQQVPIMENLYNFLLTHSHEPRGRIVLPTGVGKTVLFTEFVKATGLRTLVLTPTTMLLHQTEQAFHRFNGDEEISVGKVYGQQKEEDQITLTTYASFVRHTKDEDSPYLGPGKYDLIICDEAHRAMADGTKAALEQYDGTIQIGLTATENYSAKRKLEKVLPHLVHHMTIREAVESRLIAPFSNWVVETDTDMSDVGITVSNEYDQEQLQSAVNTTIRNQLAVDMYRTFFNGKKVVFFCSGVDHSKAMAELLRQNGVRAEAIHGGLTVRKQQGLKNMFADQDPETGIAVLCNDKILAEGFDEVSVVACFNLAPTLSLVRAQQRSGRTLRLDPANPQKHAYVIDFVDKNYEKPPVLFADPHVGGAALIGGEYDPLVDALGVEYNLGKAMVIRDPEAVEQMANSFYESRQDKREPAPEGWVTITGLASQFDLSVHEARIVLAEIEALVPDLLETDSGRFTARGVEDGVTTYYSPRIIQGAESLVEEILKDRLKVAPEHWLCLGQVAALYGVSDEQKLRRELRTLAANFADSSGMFKHPKPAHSHRKEFFSPDVVNSYAQLYSYEPWTGIPPEDWPTWEQLSEQYTPQLITAAQEYVQLSFAGVLSNNSLLNGNKLQLGPRIVTIIKGQLEPPARWGNVASLAHLLDVDREIATRIVEEFAAEKPDLFKYDSRLCWYEDQEMAFYSQRLVERLGAYFDEHKDQFMSQDLQELSDGHEIDIPHPELIAGLAPPPVETVVTEIEIIPAQIARRVIIRQRQHVHDIVFGAHTSRPNVRVKIRKETENEPKPEKRPTPQVTISAPERTPVLSQTSPVAVTPTARVVQTTSRAALLKKYRR